MKTNLSVPPPLRVHNPCGMNLRGRDEGDEDGERSALAAGWGADTRGPPGRNGRALVRSSECPVRPSVRLDGDEAV